MLRLKKKIMVFEKNVGKSGGMWRKIITFAVEKILD